MDDLIERILDIIEKGGVWWGMCALAIMVGLPKLPDLIRACGEVWNTRTRNRQKHEANMAKIANQIQKRKIGK